MTPDRDDWFEAFRNFMQFYPKLSVAMAFGTMSAVSRMFPNSPSTIDKFAKATPVRHSATGALPATTRSEARKTSKPAAGKSAKRTSGRRKAG